MSNIMMQRNVEAGHDLCIRINRAQNASIPSPLRAGGSASADHGVRQYGRTQLTLGKIALTGEKIIRSHGEKAYPLTRVYFALTRERNEKFESKKAE